MLLTENILKGNSYKFDELDNLSHDDEEIINLVIEEKRLIMTLENKRVIYFILCGNSGAQEIYECIFTNY